MISRCVTLQQRSSVCVECNAEICINNVRTVAADALPTCGGGATPGRRRPFDDYREPRYKRSRPDYDREAYYKDSRRDGRPPRYNMVRRETFLNGSYSDYMREYTRAPTMNMPGYGAPPPPYGHHGHHMEAMPPYQPHHYDRPPRDYGPPPVDYGPPSASRSRMDKRSASKYERDVDDFLRRTTTHGVTSTSSSSGRDRDRRHREHRR